MSQGPKREQGWEGRRGALDGARVAFVVANGGAERRELVEPWRAVVAAAGIPLLVAPEADDVLLLDHLDSRTCWKADLTTDELQVEDIDALVLCGGLAGADRLRADGPAVELLRDAFDGGRPVAAMSDAPWALVEADVLEDRTLTSSASLRTELENAGAEWADEPVHACRHGPNTLVTSRGQDDLEAFCDAFVRVVSAAQRQAGLRPGGGVRVRADPGGRQ